MGKSPRNGGFKEKIIYTWRFSSLRKSRKWWTVQLATWLKKPDAVNHVGVSLNRPGLGHCPAHPSSKTEKRRWAWFTLVFSRLLQQLVTIIVVSFFHKHTSLSDMFQRFSNSNLLVQGISFAEDPNCQGVSCGQHQAWRWGNQLTWHIIDLGSPEILMFLWFTRW